MSDVRKRVISNIRAEARNFLKREIPMPDRDPRWDDMKAKILVEERELYEKEIEAKHMADYETMNASLAKAYQQTDSGIPYEEWLEKVKKNYIISGTTVTSLACGPDKEKRWQIDSFWQRKKKVMQLIYWMYYNHFLRDGEARTKKLRHDPDKESEDE